MPTKLSIHGATVFKNERTPLLESIYGGVKFVEDLELFRYPSIFGQVRFLDIRAFPPYEDGEPVPPSYSLIETPAFDNLVVEYGRHTEQRASLDDAPRWTFGLKFHGLTPAYRKRLCDFFLARKGNHQPFTLIHPLNGLHGIVRFAQSSAEFELFSYRLYSQGVVELIQVDEVFY